MVKGKILVIDDEEQLRKLLTRIISLEGYEVLEAKNVASALHLIKQETFDVVVCDVKLPDGNGVEFTTTIKEMIPTVEVIILTAYGNIPDGIRAIKNGAFDYITKGNDNDRLIPLIAQAMDKVIQYKSSAVKIDVKASTSFQKILGESVLIQQAKRTAQKIAPTEATVLLLGETGTGKEVFANAIHSASNRSTKSFIAINCSAFSKELLESELFGYKSGAFTSAVKDKKGLIEIADGGTLFLDEIGEMDVDLQSKLLRVLENGEYIKIGDVKTSHVNVRIIAATNRDLPKEISKGNFREDLYYRLNVLSIQLPALRDRKDDIPVLVSFFMGRYSSKEAKRISREAMEMLKSHLWKGNIRELKNVIDRTLILSEGTEILVTDLPFEVQSQTEKPQGLSLAEVEKSHIKKILHYTSYNKTKTAQLLNIGLNTLYRKMEEYGIARSQE